MFIYSLRGTIPTQQEALKMYAEQGKEACQEALYLTAPVLQEEDVKKLQAEIDKIDLSAEGRTPLIVVKDIARVYETAQREKGDSDKARREKLENLFRAVSGSAYLPYTESLASGEEEKRKARQNFPADYAMIKDALATAIAESKAFRQK